VKFLLSGDSGVVSPEKGGHMDTINALTIALLVALLVIDRLTR
jgi:hypothetical protein